MDDENFDQIKFRIYCNIHYNSARYRFFNLIDKLINLSIIGSGSAIFTEISAYTQIITSIFISILGIIQLVFDPRGLSIRHENLRKLYHDLLNKLMEVDKNSESDLRKIKQEIIKISSDEPPTLKVLDLISHNRSCDALGYPKTDKYIISKSYYLLAQFFSFENFELKKYQPNQ